MAKEIKTLETEFYRYTGETTDDLPDGKGHMDYLGDDFFISYDGEFSQGVENGHGRQVTIDGTVECEFVKGHPKGEGTYIFPDGSIYRGQIDEVPEGQGRIEYDNGDVFEGTFKGGYPDGEGTMTYSDGSAVTGIFSDRECIEER
ncbi:MAG: hypothetical protein IJI05_03130 [Erysipelotrichaceae bacterium]|nr:hypothetical protein [Erysipelotrichaceae bacterium]